MSTKETIHRVVAEFARTSDLATDFDVIAAGLIDSLSLFDLVAALEERLGTSIPLGDFTLDDFRTVDGLAAKLDAVT